jgi:hypothetical protein
MPANLCNLYNYLLTGASKAFQDTDEPRLVDTQATAESELIGPFQVPIPLTLDVTEGHTLVDADGLAIREIVEPVTESFLRPAPGASATTVTATTPHDLTGRVLTGVALEGAPQQLTRIALTVPTDLATEFDIICQTDQSCTDTA